MAESYTTEKTLVSILAGTGTDVRYTLDGSEPTAASMAYGGPFEVAGSMTIRAVALRDDWFDSPVASAATVRMPWTHGECLNCEELGFSSGDTGEWGRDLVVTHDGVAAMRSGEIGNNATSRLEVTIWGDGELSFWWKASTEVYRGHPMDLGVLVVDGQDVADIYGETDWARESIVLSGDGRHQVRWEFRKDEMDDPLSVGDDGVWLDEVVWMPVRPSVTDDPGATVTGDAETGFVVRPSEGKTSVEVSIPPGLDAAKVTIEASVKVASVTPHGAKVRVVNGGADVTAYLDIPGTMPCDGGGVVATEKDGVIDLTKATVKKAVVNEALDSEKGAVVELNAANPSIATAPTKVGLKYSFREGTALEGLGAKEPSATKTGDGKPWSPKITVKGGKSAFYSIGVGKGE